MTKGFTLLEVLISIALMALFLGAITAIMFGILQNYQKLQTVDDVQYNARFASEKIIRSMRDADQIDFDSTTFDVDPGILTLEMDDTAQDPTVFSVIDGILYVKRGTNPEIAITTNNVDVTNFTLTDRTPTNEKGSIIVTLTISHENPNGSRMYHYEETLEFAVTSRQR